MLKGFKNSSDKRVRGDVFSCMLRNLLPAVRYPYRELNTTAVLFGDIIEQGLITWVSPAAAVHTCELFLAAEQVRILIVRVVLLLSCLYVHIVKLTCSVRVHEHV